MKKIITFFCVLALSLVTLVLVGSLNVNAATSDAYTIITNPGEHADTEMNIQWHTDLTNTQSKLIYTKKSDTKWADAITVQPTRETCTAYTQAQSVDANKIKREQTPFLRCVVNLVDLESDTEYMYKVGQTVMSDIHYFKTGGAIEYSVAIISDFHSYLPLPNRLTAAMAMLDKIEAYDKSIDFMLDVGDTCAYGGCENFWRKNFEEQNYKDYMWCGCNGNHDDMDNTGTKCSNQYFANSHAMPLNGYEGEEGVVYYFIYSDTLYIALNNEDMGADDVPKVQEWMQGVIDNNPTKYIVVWEHYQWFNFSGSDTHYNRWKDFFDKNGVDLAISGNHHIYGRTNTVKGGEENEYGTMYLETSSSDNERGQSGFTIASTNDLTQVPTASATQKKLVKYFFNEGGKTVSGVLLNVNAEGMKVTLLDRNGTKLDTGTIKAKRETPTLTEEDKNTIGDNVSYVQNAKGDKVLVLPEKLMGFTLGYEVYNGTNKIYSSNFSSVASKYAKLDLEDNQAYDLSLLVKYKDGTNKTYPITVNTKQNANFLSGLNSIAKKLNWEVKDTQTQIAKYEIYCNDVKVGEATTNSFDLTSLAHGDKYTVKALDKDGKVLDTLSYNLGTFGDVNLDGVVDDKDILIIQKCINGELTAKEKTNYYADVNGDGKVTIQDACYIKMYLAGFLTYYTKVTYTVKFIGVNGEVAEEVQVAPGKDATPTFLDKYNYNVVSWSDDYKNITEDKTITGVYAKKEY